MTERLEGRDLQTPAPRGEARARENEQGRERARMGRSVRPANTMAVPTGRCCMAWKASSERGILLRRYVNLPIIKRGCCTHIKCGNVRPQSKTTRRWLFICGTCCVSLAIRSAPLGLNSGPTKSIDARNRTPLNHQPVGHWPIEHFAVSSVEDASPVLMHQSLVPMQWSLFMLRSRRPAYSSKTGTDPAVYCRENRSE